jgi:hypothetical protein
MIWRERLPIGSRSRSCYPEDSLEPAVGAHPGSSSLLGQRLVRAAPARALMTARGRLYLEAIATGAPHL